MYRYTITIVTIILGGPNGVIALQIQQVSWYATIQKDNQMIPIAPVNQKQDAELEILKFA